MQDSIEQDKIPYPGEDIEIVELGDSSSVFISGFESEIKEIEAFLKEDALKQEKEGVNRTFLWMSREYHQILGYITICADAINLDKVQKDEMIRRGINYKSLPALKIGRMGVQKSFCRKGIGTKMIAFAVDRAVKIHRIAACRFITVDAKNDEIIPERLKPERFYKKNGFEILKTKEKSNVVHMYKNLVNIIKEEEKIKP
ncbi:MAG: GNAT family N-acetyltransferase [Candidatus ainarchaeum sp.]|nr:GNAT family N-acetyltransferase [Candidatus ainarchaeum sp.]